MTLDVSPWIDFIETEFRSRFRNVVDQITMPIPRRVDQYTCWPGLTVTSADASSGRLELAFKSNPSKLRAGEHVYVNALETAPKDVISGPEGIVRTIDESAGRVGLEPGYQQAPRFLGRFRVGDRVVLDQTLPGSRLGREMPILALRLVSGELGDAPRLRRIRDLLTGAESWQPTGHTYHPEPRADLGRLTDAQHEALRRGVETDFAMIQGPPGTGKTFVLGLLIRELVSRGLDVGVCAFTHLAINNVLAECLRHREIDEVCKLGTRGTWTGSAPMDRLRLIPRPAQFFRNKSTPPVVGFTQHAAFNPVARALEDGVAQALPDRFDVLVFDEASQLTVPAAVMAMVQADRFVLVGDHEQLPPLSQTMRSGFGPGASVFQHLVERAGHEPVVLDRTFRLNRELVAFPSEEFYGGVLESAPSAAERRLELPASDSPLAPLLAPDPPSQLAVVRHTGRGQESREEAALAAGLVEEALAGGVPPQEIAVIAPHRRQNVKIREYLARAGITGEHPVVDTVERIQGQERDLVILSMTLSDPDVLSNESDFLFLPNRFNVAITRARRKLVVIASPLFFRALPRHDGSGGPEASPLLAMNVLKRWYFRHRDSAIDATGLATSALERLTNEKPTKEDEPVSRTASAPHE